MPFTLIFLAFAALTILSALLVILAKNPVQSALYLVLTFFSASALWIMQNAEFLGLILIIVYVGAVMTLFLFVLMTIDSQNRQQTIPKTQLLSAALIFTVFLLAMYKALHTYTPGNFISTLATNPSNTHQLGTLLYTHYVYAFEIAGVLLLTAIIAAVSLHRNKKPESQIMPIAEQLTVQAKDRLKIIKMPAEKPKGDSAI